MKMTDTDTPLESLEYIDATERGRTYGVVVLGLTEDVARYLVHLGDASFFGSRTGVYLPVADMAAAHRHVESAAHRVANPLPQQTRSHRRCKDCGAPITRGTYCDGCQSDHQ